MSNVPLAERMRPKTLDDYIGQQHLVGEKSILREMISSGNLSSFILWGPPGVGKTTLAKIIANKLKRPFHLLSAVNSGVKDIREVIDKAKSQKFFDTPAPILFIDEIHRFSKSQQDSLLGAVEQGVVVLIGATTENPSFEVIAPLLSRCQVYVLRNMEEDDLKNFFLRRLKVIPYLKNINLALRKPMPFFVFRVVMPGNCLIFLR
jgi:putative ATPase